jgi:hypothetical protein
MSYDLEIDPKLSIYPFKYFTLYIGNEKIIISPEKYNDNEYTFEIDNRTNQAYLSIKCNGEYISQLRGLPIESNGSVSYTLNALDEYLIRNGNQKRTAVELSKISGIISLFGSLIGGLKSSYYSPKPASYNVGGMITDMTAVAVNAMSKEFNQIALEKDISKMQDRVSTTDYGEDDLLYQDKVVIIANTSKDVDFYNYKKYEFYLYGYNINRSDYPLMNYRYWFDYVRGECYIPAITNERDRNEINEIFKRGVFKYHYNFDDNRFDSEFRKDASLNNLEQHLIEI